MEQEAIVKEKEIPVNFKKWCKKAFGEHLDQIDVLSHYDRELNYTENKQAFIDNFSSMFCKEYVEEMKLKDVKEQAKAQQEQMLNEIKKEERKLVEEWKKTDYEDINIRSFDTPKHFIQMVCRGICNSCVLVGGGGTGKTFLSTNTMKKEKVDFVYQNTYTTPLELYKYLYENRDKIIVLDDIDGLWNNEKCLAILKSALWETDGKRILTMNTSDKVLQNTPKIFEFKGRIIILSNKINKDDEHISALLSRSNYFELNFTYKEKLRIMKEITKKPYKKTEKTLRDKALDMIIKNTDISTEDLNFRTLIKTYDLLIYNRDKAENLLKSTLQVNQDIKLVMDLLKSNKGVNEQIAEFTLKTGKSRATYFRIKDKIKEMMK
jgi:hypothetical protein